jgi:hypothetical protein
MPSVTFAKRDNSPAMPIRQFLNDERFDPETTRILGVAFEAARIALRLADRGDAFAPIVAKRIIELAKTGERNPDVSEPRKVRSPQECSAEPTLIGRLDGAFRTQQGRDTYVTRRSNRTCRRAGSH